MTHRRTFGLAVVMSLVVAGACDSGGEQESSPTRDTVAPSAAPATTAPPPDSSAFEATSCRFQNRSGLRAECGDLSVPEDHNDPDSPMIKLHVAVFPALTDSPAPDPVVYLDGGPGGETLERLSATFDDLFLPYLQERDVVFFDQRGVGFSEPSLDCPELRELSKELLDDDFDDDTMDLEFEAWEACRDRLLAEGVNLSTYHSAASAADVADLRRALGYEQWNLLGVSYGTRLALTIMRDDPAGVRSVILDSAYPPQVSPVDEPTRFDRALDLFFAACDADTACAAEYPDLRERFFALVEQLDAEPIVITVFDEVDGVPREALIDGVALTELVWESLYSAVSIRLLPQMVAEIENGKYTTITRIAAFALAQRESFSLGMHFAVQCHEEYPFTTSDQYAAAIEPYPELSDYFRAALFYGDNALGMCELWPTGVGGDIETEPVSSDLPTLVLAGQFDPITPPSWGRSAAETLTNSYFFEIPSIGHGAVFEHICAVAMARAFLNEPTAEPDDSCIAEVAPIAFTP